MAAESAVADQIDELDRGGVHRWRPPPNEMLLEAACGVAGDDSGEQAR
jgi:hypothetical protein